jgi:Co/Zn/Cd efflux system component
VVSVDILGSIAVVRLEVAGWSGKLAGSDARMSDLFTLLKMPSGWAIIQKAFHWHA